VVDDHVGQSGIPRVAHGASPDGVVAIG